MFTAILGYWILAYCNLIKTMTIQKLHVSQYPKLWLHFGYEEKRTVLKKSIPKHIPHLCLLTRLYDDAIGRVIEFSGYNAEKFCLVLISIVVGRTNTDQLMKRKAAHIMYVLKAVHVRGSLQDQTNTSPSIVLFSQQGSVSDSMGKSIKQQVIIKKNYVPLHSKFSESLREHHLFLKS